MYSWTTFSSVTQSCPTLQPLELHMPGLPVHHQLPQFTQTHESPYWIPKTKTLYVNYRAFLGGSAVKNLPATAGYRGGVGSVSGSRRSPGGGNSNSFIPVFLPGKYHGQRSMAGYITGSCKIIRYDWVTQGARARMHIHTKFNYRPIIIITKTGDLGAITLKSCSSVLWTCPDFNTS